MPIPTGLNRNHVLAALSAIDNGIEHEFGQSTKFDLIYKGNRYPPKAVLALACENMTGTRLAPSDFSGGEETNTLLSRLDFPILPKESIGVWPLCAEFIETYADRPPRISKETIQYNLIKEIEQKISMLASTLVPNANWITDSSIGKGNWATIPWLAIYDRRQTDSPRKGVYPVVHLLSSSPPAVRFGIGISVTEFKNRLQQRAVEVLNEIPLLHRTALRERGFRSDYDDQDGRNADSQSGIGAKYDEGMVLQKLIQLDTLRADHIAVYEDLACILRGYKAWVDSTAKGDTANTPDANHPIAQDDTHPLNLILYGPPGTGKTYSSLERAVRICDKTILSSRDAIMQRYKALQDAGRIGFVTFHQSLSYEEFVEGIRPVTGPDVDSDSETTSGISYSCQPGIFKDIAALANSARPSRGRNPGVNIDNVTVWKMSLGNSTERADQAVYDDCIENSYIGIGYGGNIDFSDCHNKASVMSRFREHHPDRAKIDYTITAVDTFVNKMRPNDLVVVSDGNKKFRAIGKVTGDYYLSTDDGYKQRRSAEWLRVFDESLPRERILNKQFTMKTIYELKDVLIRDSLQTLLVPNISSEVDNYVLIIDEINRANISKVFGELISLLEPDKRIGGVNELRATLPYSGNPFGVPANLYIIGTMNTADRSIALIDTALRRRFEFEELMPKSEIVRQYLVSDAILAEADPPRVLDVLNARIEALFDRDHMIGHSYFLNLQSIGAMRKIFLKKIIPLLQEYFYGDWSKVCLVLGCPYRFDGGKPVTRNSYPVIDASSLRGILPAEFENDDEDGGLRFEVNQDFVQAEDAVLKHYFSGIVELGGMDQ